MDADFSLKLSQRRGEGEMRKGRKAMQCKGREGRARVGEGEDTFCLADGFTKVSLETTFKAYCDLLGRDVPKKH